MPLASSQRALPLVARTDLVARTVRFGNEQYWVIKNPLSLEYFRLQADQYAVLKLLDGRRTLNEIRAALQRQFPAFRTSPQQIQQLITDLFQKGLVWSTRTGQSEILAERNRERRRRRVVAAAQNLLFIRLPGWDPQWVLDCCYPIARWLLHPMAICLGFALVISAWCCLLHRIDEFHVLLPRLEELGTARFLIPLWLTLGAVKVLHEFGHAFACRHFGCECHEMGVAFLVFSPCMYCDVSDASVLSNRWQRIAISAAGIYVELVLSAVAFFTWRYTNAGLLHDIGLSVFLVTNISTMLFNLNPLLRLDGYYILSDLLQVPNLREKANRLLDSSLKQSCLGIAPAEDPFLPTRGQHWFVVYALAAMVYRWHLVLVICLVLYATLKPFGLQSVGLLIGASAMLTAFVGVYGKVAGAVRRHRDQMSRSWRPLITLGGVTVAFALLLFAPFPMPVTVPIVVEPHQIRHVFAATPGRLVTVFVRPGQRVQQGEPLVQLENPSRLDQFIQLRTAFSVQQVELTVQQARGDAAQTAVAADTLRDLHAETSNLHRQLTGMLITAPCDGIILDPPPVAQAPTNDRASRLPRWHGSPLDRHNLGAFLEPRTHLLSIAPHEHYQATLLINQSVRRQFTNGTNVWIKVDSLPAETYRGSIEECTDWIDGHHVWSDSLEAMNPLIAKASHTNVVPRIYQATVVFPTTAARLGWGMRGSARIIVTRRSAARWLWRYMRTTFDFHV